MLYLSNSKYVKLGAILGHKPKNVFVWARLCVPKQVQIRDSTLYGNATDPHTLHNNGVGVRLIA